MKKISYDEWVKEYKPLTNEHGDLKEFYGENMRSLEFDKAWREQRIWTRIGEGEDIFILPGFHFVNRMEHFVTEIPWESDKIEVD